MVKRIEEMYLRFVLTKRCPFKCYFCHREGDAESPGFELSREVVIEAVRVAMSLGIYSFKFTGGEPLEYEGLADVIAEIKSICPSAEISFTTNGLYLERDLVKLIEAGIDRANVSLQSLDRKKNEEIVGVDSFDEVMRGIELLSKFKTDSKIVTAFSKRNEDEILDMARFAKRLGLGFRVHAVLPALPIAEPDVIPIEEIEERISRFPGAVRRIIEVNGKHRLLFTGPDWEILVPDWRHWKRCGMASCPLNDNVKKVCKEGEVFALRITPSEVQTCLMRNKKNFPFEKVGDIREALTSACKLVAVTS